MVTSAHDAAARAAASADAPPPPPSPADRRAHKKQHTPRASSLGSAPPTCAKLTRSPAAFWTAKVKLGSAARDSSRASE